MKLSIVATLYQSSAHIAEFHAQMSAAAKELVEDDYEIILVNDGSPDNSLDLAIELTQQDKHLTVIDLSRNFGHHKAMMTGLNHTRGERVFLIDSDLEEQPEWLLGFSEELLKKNCDVIYGMQRERKGGWFEQVSGPLFYKAFDVLTGLDLPKNIVTARLMTRRYVDALLQHKDKEVFLAGLWHITGFEQHPQLITKKNTSASTYNLRRKLSILVNSVTSFSNAPLKAIFYIGLLISFLASLYIAYLVVVKIFFITPLSGWTSLMASIWLLGGMIISFLGVIGIYLSKIFSETKDRPYTTIRQIYGKQK